MKSKLNNSVIIFSKYPREGKVKTRLAKSYGDKFAVDFYRSCADHIFNECLKLIQHGIQVCVFYPDEKDKNEMLDWIPGEFNLYNQIGSSLGDKIANAFNFVFNNGTDNALIIGTDIPDITSELIINGIDYLQNIDVVVGPSLDGGYYLLGMNQFYKNLFADVQWSTSSVLNQTLRNANNENLKIKLLPELTDIDTDKDLMNWIQKDKVNKADSFRSKLNRIMNEIKS